LRTLKMVTLGFSLIDNSAGDSSGNGTLIWRRSLATAVLARHLAPAIGPELAEDAFTAGLMSNVGKTALLDVPEFAEFTDEVGMWLTPDDERAAIGVTSDELSARILDGWQLPSLLSEAIWTRHPEGPEDFPGPLGAILRLADWASCLLLAERDEDVAIAYDQVTLAAAHLGLTIDEVQRIVALASPEFDDMTSSFEVDAINPDSFDNIVRSAQAGLARMTLDIVSQIGEEQRRNDELVETNQELAAAASTDGLTGLPNRRTFDAFLSNQVGSRMRHGRESALGLIVMDLDHFKSVNDTYGHAVGDEVLIEVGKRLSSGSRRGELVARTGGEEFALIMPEVEPKDLAGAGERLRRMLADQPVDTEAGPLPITFSLGGAWAIEVDESTEQWLYQTADAALYASKENGRNRVTVSDPKA
ncbi:MAG: diguanylate cyclase, partial [Actinomycetota bacterium]